MTSGSVGPITLSKGRVTLALLFCAVATVLTLVLATSAAKADMTCATANFCSWSGAGYTGAKDVKDCNYSGTIGTSFSAKNRCGKSRMLGWSEGGGITWKFCMGPGGDRPDPGRFNFISVLSGSC